MTESTHQRKVSHDYADTAKGYADLGIEKTFYLAYREVERIIRDNSLSGLAVDVGCGGGRSTRFLQDLGFNCVGVDVESSQIEASLARDSTGDYRVVEGKQLPIDDEYSDLTLSCIVLLECPSRSKLEDSVAELARITKPDGTVVVVTASEDSLSNSWASFENNFPENQNLKSGDQAKVVVRGTDAVFYDYYWSDADYRAAFKKAGLEVSQLSQPLADGTEPFEWISEKDKPNWSIYVLKRAT